MEPVNQIPPQTPQLPEEGNSMKWIVAIGVGVVLVAILGWMFMQKETPTPTPQKTAPVVEIQVPVTSDTPPTTGNIDDIISSLENAEAAEALVANAGDNDISLVTSDADAVSGMNTLYNDNEF
ncbi:MAG: hypothetical protein Q7S11_02420 [bacterium]|nr:hypothetical protein [bacterium]